MCNSASFVLTEKDVLWSQTSDKHEDIIKDNGLDDTKLPPYFVRVEIVPPDMRYDKPLTEWEYIVDQDILPSWYDPESNEARARAALPQWAEVHLAGINLTEAYNPVNPLLLKRKRISKKKLLELLKQWDSVSASVRYPVNNSVWDSVRDSVSYSVSYSVCASVWDSIGDSVRDSVSYLVCASVCASVWDSVRDSIYAYIGGLFLNRIKEWKHAEALGENPWKPLLTLWYAGYVPSFDGGTWRLYAGLKAEVVLEWEKEQK